jgi:hypothetical protein
LINCNGSSQRQEYPHSLITASTKNSARLFPTANKKTTWLKVYSKSAQVQWTDISLIRNKTSQSSHIILCGGILDRSFYPPRFNLPYTYSTGLTIHHTESSSIISDVPLSHSILLCQKNSQLFQTFPHAR